MTQLQRAEEDWRRERQSAVPSDSALRTLVVARGCAAYHSTRLRPGATHAVWLYTKVQILAVQPSAAGLRVKARATTVDGPVVSSRITLSRGLHHACFALTDATGTVICALVDTHPHGDGPNDGAADHEGPIVATVAGSVTPTRVQLPAVTRREVPFFAAARPLH